MNNLEHEVNVATFSIEEFAQKLIEAANEFKAKDYKKNALKELDDLEERGIHIPYSAFIVHDYPDFNHIMLKVTFPDTFAIKICINPESIKENPQIAYRLAELYKSFFELVAKEE